MGLILNIVNNVVPRVQKRVSNGDDFKIALAEELEKEIAQSHADQNNGKEHIKKSKNIIPPAKDIDNGKIALDKYSRS